LNKAKPFEIPKPMVMDAYKLVKGNAGSAGIDKQTIADFERNLKDNLYKIWNRMSSGSYFPTPVKAVPIPKKSGGERILGVPTVEDRIAQMVVKLMFEPKVEPYFHNDSYGYRPNKSALDAVGITRKRCWEYDWCLEFDIKGLFDNIDHLLLMKAIRKHTDNKWVILYIERWLKAPLQLVDGSLVERSKGTPQGSVISPVLSNLFLHYVFDHWMSKKHKSTPWCRYADDGLAHCKTVHEARQLLAELMARFEECGLELHPDKTKIIYCKDSNRKGNHRDTEFDFLGFTFKGRTVKSNKSNDLFLSFTAAASKQSINAMRTHTRVRRFGKQTDLELEDIARIYNPVLRGWINYYGSYSRSTLYPVFRHFNQTLITWVMQKHKKLRSKTKAIEFLDRTMREKPYLFAHWKIGMIGAFA
jgi:RNA-directed DNA polymerase